MATKNYKVDTETYSDIIRYLMNKYGGEIKQKEEGNILICQTPQGNMKANVPLIRKEGRCIEMVFDDLDKELFLELNERFRLEDTK
ncbi:MAG: hypothetical protein AABX30_02280 [Nanoarchaeota archaeon]